MELPLSSLMKKIKCSHRLLWIAILVVFMGMISSCVFLLSRAKFSERPESVECQKCHKQTYNQWNSSPHSRATKSERFLFLTDNLNLGVCDSCHSPRTIWTEGTPLSSSGSRQGRGVDCASCHWHDGMIVADAFSRKAHHSHPLQVDDALRTDSYVCGQCHRKPFNEMQRFKALPQQLTCQQCHMERLAEEKLKAKKGFKKAYKLGYEGYADHSFRIEDLAHFPGAMALNLDSSTLSTETLSIHFTLVNYLPHSIPAVEYGSNRVLVSAELLLSGSSKSLKKEFVFNRQKPIKPFSEKSFEYSFNIGKEKVDSLSINIYHQREKNSKKIIMFSRKFNIKSPGTD
ncbi:hypothetical protein J7M23_06435 [Candidatus Sumerlaeota bacterium]|nr:hypothetical protein [Candidatus Sumerlaeota bacterium]